MIGLKFNLSGLDSLLLASSTYFILQKNDFMTLKTSMSWGWDYQRELLGISGRNYNIRKGDFTAWQQ